MRDPAYSFAFDDDDDDDDDTLALKCVSALRSARDVVQDAPRHAIVVAPNPDALDDLEEEEAVALDATRYPGILVPWELRDSIRCVVERVTALGACGAVTVTGYCVGAAVAAYAAVCARAAVAIGSGHEPVIRSVTFGIPIGTRVPCDTGTHFVSTRHTACMHPCALDTSHVRWVGEKDALYYANRVLGAFVRPVHHEPLDAYVELLLRRTAAPTAASAEPMVVVAHEDEAEWQSV